MGILNRISNALEIPLRWFGIFLIAVIIVFTFFGVVARYCFGASYSYLAEWSVWSLIICTFIMAAVVERGNQHINIDMIYRYLPKRGQKIVIIFSCLALLFFCVILVLSGIKVIGLQMGLGIKSSAEVAVPLWVPRLFIPLSAILLAFYAVEELIKAIVSFFTPSSGAKEN